MKNNEQINKCPNCGANFKNGKCDYCGSKFEKEEPEIRRKVIFGPSCEGFNSHIFGSHSSLTVNTHSLWE